MKVGKKLLTILVVLTFFLSLNTAMNAGNIDTSTKNKTTYQYNEVESKTNYCKCTLLDGKYPIMGYRGFEPKTKMDFYSEPQPTISYYNDLPTQFSWADHNGDWTTPAKDQESCGSCWDFSAISTMEAQINLASGYPDTDIDLSEQYVLSCLPYGGSCNGGWTDDAFAAIISTDLSIGNGINGVPLETCMPYQAIDYLPCSDKCADWDYYTIPPETDNILWQLEDWGANHNFENDNPDDRDIVKSWLMDKGPVSVSMYATSSFSNYWNTHHNPDDYYFEEDSYGTNHAVLLVGWKDDASIQNGGYWIVKNSWGSSWGYSGFFNAVYGGQNIAEIVRWCTTSEWPEEEQGPGPGTPEMHVYADFSYDIIYPHLGEEIEFIDKSLGPVVLREWDFNEDGIIDSNSKHPSWTYNQEGKYQVFLRVWSEVGLNSTIRREVEAKEIWPPVSLIDPQSYGGREYTHNFEGRYSYDVDGHIESYLWDFDDGTTSEESHLTHTFSNGDKIYDVTLTVTDNDGATSTSHCEFKIDITIPPETFAYIPGCENIDIWFNDDVKIGFYAEDWTEVDRTMYKVNDGEWKEYDDYGVVISQSGVNIISYYSIDIYGNQENIKTQEIKIDKINPTVDIQITGEQNQGWYIEAPEIKLTATDELSDVEKIVYRWELSWLEYTEPFLIENVGGTIFIDYLAIDNAGNINQKRAEIKIDLPPSKPKIAGPSKGNTGQVYDYNISSNVNYGNDVYYFIEWADETNSGWIGPYVSGEEITVTHSWGEKKVYYIKVKSKDDLDRESEWGTLAVNIPINKPCSLFFERLEKLSFFHNLIKNLLMRI